MPDSGGRSTEEGTQDYILHKRHRECPGKKWCRRNSWQCPWDSSKSSSPPAFRRAMHAFWKVQQVWPAGRGPSRGFKALVPWNFGRVNSFWHGRSSSWNILKPSASNWIDTKCVKWVKLYITPNCIKLCQMVSSRLGSPCNLTVVGLSRPIKISWKHRTHAADCLDGPGWCNCNFERRTYEELSFTGLWPSDTWDI